LRWGIPQDGTVLGSTVDLCLAEAANSIPYFIAILGCRSGWVPEIDAELIARHPWISPYVGRSITELEIRCALNQPQGETPKVFCYRREGGGDSGRGTDGSVAALQSELASHPMVELRHFDRVDAFESLVFDQLNAAIREDAFIADLSDDGQTLERAYRSVRVRLSNYRPVFEDVAQQVVAHVRARRHVALTGDIGSGKSTILLRVLELLQEDGLVPFVRPPRDDQPVGARPILLPLFVKEAGLARDFADLVRRIAEWLTQATPGGFEGEKFRRLLRRVTAHLRQDRGFDAILVIDDLHSFEREFFPDRLHALLDALPAGTSVVCSLSADSAAEYLPESRHDLRSRVEFVHIPDYPAADVVGFIEDSLAPYGKRLHARQLARILGSPLAGRPGALVSIIDELRFRATFVSLDDEITTFAEAPDLAHLHATMLERRLAVAEPQARALLRRAMRLLAVTETGLREEDLRAILGEENRLPSAHWSPIYLALKPLLRESSGRWSYRFGLTRAVALAVTGSEDVEIERFAIGLHFIGSPHSNLDVQEAARQAARAVAPGMREKLLESSAYLVRIAAVDWSEFKSLVCRNAPAVFARRELYDRVPELLVLLAWALEESGGDPRDTQYQGWAFIETVRNNEEDTSLLHMFSGTTIGPSGVAVEAIHAETERGEYGFWTRTHLAVQRLPYDAFVIYRSGGGLKTHFSTDWSTDPRVAAGGVKAEYYIGGDFGSLKAPNTLFNTEMQPTLRALKKFIMTHALQASGKFEDVPGATDSNGKAKARREYTGALSIGIAAAALLHNLDYASQLLADVVSVATETDVIKDVFNTARYFKREAAAEKDSELLFRFVALQCRAALVSDDAAMTEAAEADAREIIQVFEGSGDSARVDTILMLVQALGAAKRAYPAPAVASGDSRPVLLAAGLPVARQLLSATQGLQWLDDLLLDEFGLAHSS
jgi:hypothetical protein